jgi:hypothetical protein
MKSFAHYLTESRKTFDYRIKILGDTDAKFINALEEKLQQFDVIKMSEVKRSPIQKVLPDFPGIENEGMSFFDVSFNYPATPPQITQIARLLGLNPNHMIIQQAGYADSVDGERDGYEAQSTPLLGADYEPNTAEAEEAKDYYAADPYQRKVVGNEYSSDFTIAGGKTAPAVYNTDKPASQDSPIMGKNKIPTVTSSAGKADK